MKDLTDVIDTLGRAIAVLEKEMAKSGSDSMLQMKNANNIMQALDIMVHGAMISSADGEGLAALIQSARSEDMAIE